MKKFLLLAVATLTVVACKKDNDSTPEPNPNGGGNGNGNGNNGAQTEVPTPVPAGFVKKIEVTGQETSTTTFNVENNVLKGWTVVSPNATQTYTLEYNGKNLKKYTYESKENGSTDLYKAEFEFTYQNNKLVSFKRTRDRMTDNYDVVVDDKGRITSKTSRGDVGGWEGMVWTATFAYTDNSLVVKDQNNNTYTYTYQNGNPTALVAPFGSNFVYSYDTAVLNDLNFEYFRLTTVVELFTRHSSLTLGNGSQDVFVKSSKNILTSDGSFTYEVTEKQGTNKPKTVVKKRGGDSAVYATIKYTY